MNSNINITDSIQSKTYVLCFSMISITTNTTACINVWLCYIPADDGGGGKVFIINFNKRDDANRIRCFVSVVVASFGIPGEVPILWRPFLCRMKYSFACGKWLGERTAVLDYVEYCAFRILRLLIDTILHLVLEIRNIASFNNSASACCIKDTQYCDY